MFISVLFCMRVFQYLFMILKNPFCFIMVYKSEIYDNLKIKYGMNVMFIFQFIGNSRWFFYKNFNYIFVMFFILCFISTLFGCQKKKNVILISIDTLRADHMSCYGYARNTTPILDTFSKEGYLFKNVTSTSSWTAPAMASLFTTLMPSQHDIKHGVYKSGSIYGQEVLDESHVTLAEVLKENGLTTFGISSNPHMTEELGFAQGFDCFTLCKFRDAEEVSKTAIELMTKHKDSKPFFLWVHYFDPHWPYRKREPWIYDYVPGYNAELKRFYHMNLPKVRTAAGIEKGSSILQKLVALYDSEINYVDQSIGKLLDAVYGIEDTMIIMVSDHGEGFLEHNSLDHGYQLYEEFINVPLIIKHPAKRSEKKSFHTPCSIIDIPLTILDWLDIKNTYHFQGKSLLPLIMEKTPDEVDGSDRIIFSELNRFGKDLTSLRIGKWKYIHDFKNKKEELYDLSVDPGETINVLTEEPEFHNEVRNKLSEWLTAVGEPKVKTKRVELNDESVERLKSLGYIE